MIELKKPGVPTRAAFYENLTHYEAEIPQLFWFNALLIASNAMRPIALGRKNWLHIGDEKAGPKIAAILSVLATCRRLGIHPRDYLLAVLPKLGRTNTGDVKHLTPLAWHRARQAAAAVS